MDFNFEKLPRFKAHAFEISLLMPQWARAHQVPCDAIINQIYIAHAWADSNPKKAPKKNITRYLFNWMAQAKRYGNLKVPEKRVQAVKAVIPEPDMTFEEMQAIRKQNMRPKGGLPIELEVRDVA